MNLDEKFMLSPLHPSPKKSDRGQTTAGRGASSKVISSTTPREAKSSGPTSWEAGPCRVRRGVTVREDDVDVAGGAIEPERGQANDSRLGRAVQDADVRPEPAAPLEAGQVQPAVTGRDRSLLVEAIEIPLRQNLLTTHRDEELESQAELPELQGH